MNLTEYEKQEVVLLQCRFICYGG